MSVVLDWLSALPFKHQTVLLSALRGCDGKNKEDISKSITRFYRSLILKNADSSTNFMNGGIELFCFNFQKMLKDVDSYPVHYIFHLIHAIEIVGYYYPCEEVRRRVNDLYILSCECFHVKPEDISELDERLKDAYIN